VETVPAPAVLPEAPLPPPPASLSQPSETTNGQPPAVEEAEQPTFHVLQPPAVTSIAPSEPVITPPPTTYTQLIAVPIASDQPLVTSTPTAPVKQVKRVCIFFFL
jgi:hypothetical protein